MKITVIDKATNNVLKVKEYKSIARAANYARSMEDKGYLIKLS